MPGPCIHTLGDDADDLAVAAFDTKAGYYCPGFHMHWDAETQHWSPCELPTPPPTHTEV